MPSCSISQDFEQEIENLTMTQDDLMSAKSYINHSIKEGYLSENCTDGMTDEQIITFANDLIDRADNYADQLKEL